jgi:DNA-binding transcriptional MerR regulator
MAKSRDAFRTISEVSDVLDTPAHVLRFWESKFKQIKPVKRAGGRRYYRPDDLALLAAIKDLLHEQGHSIKNAQKLIRDAGVKTIVAQGHQLLGSADEHDIIDAPAPAPRAPEPMNEAQSDLFAGSGRAEPSTPHIEITSVEAVPDPLEDTEPEVAAFVSRGAQSQAPATTLALPDLPAPREDLQSRLLDSLGRADPAHIRANAGAMAPLIERLAALRDEMRHPW